MIFLQQHVMQCFIPLILQETALHQQEQAYLIHLSVLSTIQVPMQVTSIVRTVRTSALI